MEPIFHPNTKQAIAGFVKNPSHSVLITAPLGSGKFYMAQHIAKQLLGTGAAVENHPYYSHLLPADGTISIDAVRQLKGFLQLKTTGERQVRRIVIIEQAEAMNHEAQNALLKILEEPPSDTVIIMNSNNPTALLPTIKSRVQQIQVQKLPKNTLLDHFQGQSAADEVQKAYHMSGGQIGLMYALLQKDEQAHPLAESIAVAKELLKKPAYERLVAINDFVKADLDMLTLGLYSVAHAALVSAAEKGNTLQISKWHQTCKVIHKIQSELKYKPSTKLVLTDLFVNL